MSKELSCVKDSNTEDIPYVINYRPQSIDKYLEGAIKSKLNNKSLPKITIVSGCVGLGRLGYIAELLESNLCSNCDNCRGKLVSVNSTNLKLVSKVGYCNE